MVASREARPAMGALCWARVLALERRSQVHGVLWDTLSLVHFYLMLGLYSLLYPELPDPVMMKVSGASSLPLASCRPFFSKKKVCRRPPFFASPDPVASRGS